MVTVKELRRWLSTLDPADSIGIDDGGLALVVADDPDTYYEVGGLPEDGEEDEEVIILC